MDLYNQFAMSAQEKALDSTHFCDWLRERQSKGLDSWIHVDESGHLERAFFVMEGELKCLVIHIECHTMHTTNIFSLLHAQLTLPNLLLGIVPKLQ